MQFSGILDDMMPEYQLRRTDCFRNTASLDFCELL